MLLVIILAALLVRRGKLSRAGETGISTWRLIKPVRPIPPELTRFWQIRVGSSAVRLAILAFALTLPLWLTPAHTQLASVILLYGIVAASLAILTGWAGQISLGHIAFMGIGAATAGILISNHGWDLFLALAVGAGVAGAAALILGVPALRISGPFLAVVTLALAVTSQNYFFIQKYFPWFVPNNELSRIPIFGRIAVGTDRQFYVVCLVALAVVLAGVRALRNSHAGRAIVASNDNPQATQSFAINTARLHLMAFAISGVLAGLAGGLFVVLEQSFSSGSFSAQDGFNFFLMVVIGGLGSLPGAVLGAVYVYGVQYLLPTGGWAFLATGAGVLVVLMFFPGGIGELVYRERDWILRRFADRKGVVVPSLVADVAQAPGARAATVDEPPEEKAAFEQAGKALARSGGGP
jgi:branched-chain amino acid transport system permease protein